MWHLNHNSLSSPPQPCSRNTWRNRTPSVPSVQSQEKRAAFISHPQPSPYPQPNTTGILFQRGFPERTRCLFSHPVPICIAQMLSQVWQTWGIPGVPTTATTASTWGPNYTHYSSCRRQSFHSWSGMSGPGATTHHRVPTPKEGSHLERSRAQPSIQWQWYGGPVQTDRPAGEKALWQFLRRLTLLGTELHV